MENEVEEIVKKCIDAGYQLGIRKGLDFIKLFEYNGGIMTVKDIIERYEKQFNLVQKGL